VISTSGVAPVVFIDGGARVLLEAVRITGGGIFLLWGGGVFFESGGNIRSCLIVHNTAHNGGGAYCNSDGDVQNCTLCNNTASSAGGGIYNFLNPKTNINCIIYHNFAPSGTNYHNAGGSQAFCDASPLPAGPGNIGQPPGFLAGDYRLWLGSPCIDAGTNLPWMATASDLDGNPRIYEDRVDMGCYEFVPEPAMLALTLILTMYNVRLLRGVPQAAGTTGRRGGK
jgi:hypothetical protein